MTISGIYLVTDRNYLAGKSLDEVILDAVRGGASLIQLREKKRDHP